jgi:hypothetical protein
MSSPLTLPNGVFKGEDKNWYRICPSCKTKVKHLRRNYCIGAHNIKQPCIKCSNIKNNPSGMLGNVRLAWYKSFYKSAITRGYTWELTPQYIDVMYEEQHGRCALSGLPIYWSTTGWDHTASIDRLDNSKGYTKENVQIVHKKLNMMRGTLEVEEFIELCKAVAVKW